MNFLILIKTNSNHKMNNFVVNVEQNDDDDDGRAKFDIEFCKIGFVILNNIGAMP